ncbi:MAG: ABC transporter ATP-binding protein [Ilumatobacteraceae bacterium]
MLQRPALSIRGVTKRFGDFVAVNDLSLEVLPGTCLGLLGPNGAGKTTLMRMITGQTRAASGDISVLEHDVASDTRAARRVLGVCPQQDNMDDQQTARENLALWAALCRVPRAQRRDAVDAALQTAQLTDRADERVTNLSGGMRRRLLLGRAFVNSPKVVLLDEPTVGLDPQVRSDLWLIIDRMRRSGVTIVMSTHYIEEAERLADDIAIMNHGRVIARGTPSELRRLHAGSEAVEYVGTATTLDEIAEKATAVGLRTRRAGLSISVLGVESTPAATLDSWGRHSRRATNLEDVFVLLTGESLDA